MTHLVPLSALCISSVVSACGLVKVQTAPTSAGPTSSAPAGGESSPAPGAVADDAAARFADAYRGFDYTTCPERLCAGRMQAAAGLGRSEHVNPRMHMANPDPEWLPGWDRLPAGVDASTDDDMVWNAMTLAAAGKRWQADCHAAYGRLDVELRAHDGTWAARISAARAAGNRYQRLTGLLALLEQLAAETDTGDHAGRLRSRTGARYELEVALREEAAHELPAYAYHYLRIEPKVGFEHLRPRGTAAEEGALFCAAAAAGQVTSIPPMPKGGPFDQEVQAAVRPPVAPEDAARFAALGAANFAANTARFGFAGPSDAGLMRASALPDGVAEIIGTVRAVKPTARGLEVELSDTRRTTASYNCKSSGRIARIDAGGRVEREQSCQLRTELDETVHRMVLADVDGAVAPAAGDEVSVVGRVTSERKREPRKYHRVIEREVAAELLVSVTANDQTRVVVARAANGRPW